MVNEYLLKIAIGHKNLDNIKFVCSLQGIDINITDNAVLIFVSYLKSPIFHAINTGSFEIVSFICGMPNVDLSMKNSAVSSFSIFLVFLIKIFHENPLEFAMKREKNCPEMQKIIDLLKEKSKK